MGKQKYIVRKEMRGFLGCKTVWQNNKNGRDDTVHQLIWDSQSMFIIMLQLTSILIIGITGHGDDSIPTIKRYGTVLLKYFIRTTNATEKGSQWLC